MSHEVTTMTERKHIPLRPEQLTRKCDACDFDFSSTSELKHLEDIIGQERATRALEFGMEMNRQGYNVFVLGIQGAGKLTAVKRAVERRATEMPNPVDWLYVNNFQNPSAPRMLQLPAGQGRQFERDMEECLEFVKEQLPKVFEDEVYTNRRDALVREMTELRNKELNKLHTEAEQIGFRLQHSAQGVAIIPLIKGEPVKQDQFASLPDEEKERIERSGTQLQEKMGELNRQVRKLEKEYRGKLHELDRSVATGAIDGGMEDLRDDYREFSAVLEYLDAVKQDLIENYRDFLQSPDDQQQQQIPGMPSMPKGDQFFDKYGVNVLVDNAAEDGAPVIFESNPTFANLLGRLDYKTVFGSLVTDYSLIKPGALHRANGGFLILEARDLLRVPYGWEILKICLRDREIRITSLAEQMGYATTNSLFPEPIPLQAKVILVGDAQLYYLLYHLDPEFRELFKVKADFQPDMERTPESERLYALFLAKQCSDEGLFHLSADGVGRIVEHSSRLTDDQQKLSCQFGEITALVRNANFWAKKMGKTEVDREVVDRAIHENEYRMNRIEERMLTMIKDGIINIRTTGENVGQINGLSILDQGDHAFGRPSRITARAFMGKGGILNIERESRLSGRIHNKGVYVLAGFLQGQYARECPLQLAASLTFEQLYDEVDGDSASSTELYTILSAIGDLPLKQGIAVTGSVNQFGEVQPVGGVSRKLEGFFDVCKHHGLTGEQGALIPKSNLRHLVLKEEVRQAVEQGKFNIWAIEHVSEGMEILTGLEWGGQQEDGSFPEGSINARIVAGLERFNEQWRQLAQSQKDKDKESEDGESGDNEAKEASQE
jgi:lon-related putative ATP-dependent protease